MFTAAAADDEDFHAQDLTVGKRNEVQNTRRRG
jgi:hypothetical protein